MTLFETVATPNHPLAPPKPAASGRSTPPKTAASSGSTLVDLLDSPLAAAPTFATAPALTPASPAAPHQAAASFAAGLFGMGAGAATPPAKGLPTLSRMPDGPGAASGERTALDEVLQQHPKMAELAAEAVDDARGAASGPAAVWQELAFADLFADVAGGSQAGQPGPGQPGGLSALQASMQLIVRGLRVLNREAAGGGAAAAAGGGELRSLLSRAEAGFRHGLELLGRLGRQRELPPLLEYLEQLVLSVANMEVGAMLAVPAAWPAAPPVVAAAATLPTAAAAAAAAAAGGAAAGCGAYLLVLHRAEDVHFTLTIVDTGLGLEHHPCRTDPRTGLLQRSLGVVVPKVRRERHPSPQIPQPQPDLVQPHTLVQPYPDPDAHPNSTPTPTPELDPQPAVASKVPRERLADSGFWFLLYRQMYAAKPSSSPAEAAAQVYGTLLPALNDQPLMAAVNATTLRWRAPPLGADLTHACCALEALEACLFAGGATDAQAAYAAALWRWSILQLALIDLRGPGGQGVALSASDLVLLRLAARQTARGAAALADGPLPLSPSHAAQLQETLSRLEAAAARARGGGGTHFGGVAGSSTPPQLTLAASERQAGAARFSLFGRMLRDFDVAGLAGQSEPPPVVLPVELSLVPDAVACFNDVCNALRHATQLCEVLSNQMTHVSNTYCLRIALIQHLVINVVPLPLPATHPERASRCFWASEPMRYETQADLLRLLNLVARHFAACSFSIRVTRSFDAVRLVTVACLVAIADAVMRIRTCDVPSLLCLSYSGLADGPGGAFGFEVGSFAVESEDLQLSSPELHTARVRVLDYFGAQAVPESRRIFRFERSMEFGGAEALLLRQLCLHMAFPTEREGPTSLLPAYLSGESRLMLENFPELGFFRDIVFLFKMLMVRLK